MLLTVVGFILQTKLESSVDQTASHNNFVVRTLKVPNIL